MGRITKGYDVQGPPTRDSPLISMCYHLSIYSYNHVSSFGEKRLNEQIGMPSGRSGVAVGVRGFHEGHVGCGGVEWACSDVGVRMTHF